MSTLTDEIFDKVHATPASQRARHASLARRNSGRRRLVDPTTCDRDYSPAELEFLQAVQQYKQQSGRMFPTWSEVLEVLQGLGYQKPVASLTDRDVHS